MLAIVGILAGVLFREPPASVVDCLEGATRRRIFSAILECDQEATQAAAGDVAGPLNTEVYNRIRLTRAEAVQEREGITEDEYFLIAGEGVNKE